MGYIISLWHSLSLPYNYFVKVHFASGIQQKFCKILSSRINMETRATTTKCIHLGYDSLIDMFQYENNSYVYELCDVCRELILSDLKVSEVIKKVLKMNPFTTGHLA